MDSTEWWTATLTDACTCAATITFIIPSRTRAALVADGLVTTLTDVLAPALAQHGLTLRCNPSWWNDLVVTVGPRARSAVANSDTTREALLACVDTWLARVEECARSHHVPCLAYASAWQPVTVAVTRSDWTGIIAPLLLLQ